MPEGSVRGDVTRLLTGAFATPPVLFPSCPESDRQGWKGVPGIMGSTVSPIPAIPFTLRIQKDHETITIDN